MILCSATCRCMYVRSCFLFLFFITLQSTDENNTKIKNRYYSIFSRVSCLLYIMCVVYNNVRTTHRIKQIKYDG